MVKTDYYQAIFLGAFVAALTDSIPVLNLVNCLFCAGIVVGGMIPLWLLQRNAEDKSFFTTPEVIHLGLLTGLFGAFLSFVFQYIVFKIYGNWQVQWMIQAMDNMETLPPFWEELYAELQKPEYQGFAGLAILIRNLIIFPVFMVLGGLLMNKILIRKRSNRSGDSDR
ncbi:MAG: hypothetical protein GXO77_16390 [Calditrichaeota bacterium]|nr:hypothetical protein [Calditrichota bacterium]